MREVPACPHHPGSRVWRDGTYATARGPRPRYRCVPRDGARSHRFVEPAAAPRGYAFTAEEIAAALVEAGRGTSYREAAARARAHAGAPQSADGNTVAGWIDRFAPAIAARHAVDRWPDVVAVDALALRSRTARPFTVYAALEPLRGRRSRLAALETAQGWRTFLRSRAGAPRVAVCGAQADAHAAVESAWPDAVVVLSHVHLTWQLVALLEDEGIAGDDPYMHAAARALADVEGWRAFLALPAPRRLRSVEDWVEVLRPRVEWQLEHALREAVVVPALLEAKLERLRAIVEPRCANLQNRARTNRLLALVRLELDGRADADAYARAILP